MSNKLVKHPPQQEEKEKPISQTFGMVFLVCGIIWLLIILAIDLSGVPTNLDGTTAKIIVVASCIVVGVSLVLLGLFYIIKKPKIKIDGYTAKWLAKEMEKEMEADGRKMTEEEKKLFMETMKDTKI